MREWVSLNGRLMPAEQAHVSVFDAGLMQGVGLFETMRTYGGAVFRLDGHLNRLISSAQKLGWTVVPHAAELRHNVRQVVNATEQAEANVRLTVTTVQVSPTFDFNAANFTTPANGTRQSGELIVGYSP